MLYYKINENDQPGSIKDFLTRNAYYIVEDRDTFTSHKRCLMFLNRALKRMKESKRYPKSSKKSYNKVLIHYSMKDFKTSWIRDLVDQDEYKELYEYMKDI